MRPILRRLAETHRSVHSGRRLEHLRIPGPGGDQSSLFSGLGSAGPLVGPR